MTTRRLGLQPLLQAVYSRLTTHDLTKDYLVYNYVTPSTAMPYIRIGDLMGAPSAVFGSRDTEAEDNVFFVHVWSDAAGDYEAAGMMDNVVQAITESDLSIVGYGEAKMCVFESGDILQDTTEPAKLVYHGVCRFRCHMIYAS
jgi:hypothetical protein